MHDIKEWQVEIPGVRTSVFQQNPIDTLTSRDPVTSSLLQPAYSSGALVAVVFLWRHSDVYAGLSSLLHPHKRKFHVPVGIQEWYTRLERMTDCKRKALQEVTRCDIWMGSDGVGGKRYKGRTEWPSGANDTWSLQINYKRAQDNSGQEHTRRLADTYNSIKFSNDGVLNSTFYLTVAWLRNLVADLSPWRPRFLPGEAYVTFMVSYVALG
jgi:hypothetical protein